MYKNVMVPLDGSSLAECILPHVDTLAKAGLIEKVTFIRVAEPVRVPVDIEAPVLDKQWQETQAERRAEAEDYLSKLIGRLNYGKVNVRSQVLIGTAADSLADYAVKKGIDLIIIASHGRSGISRWVWGSVAERILRSARVPVLIVKAPGRDPGV